MTPLDEHSPALDTNGDTAIVMRWREGKEGGGKGELLSEDLSLTLATNNDQTVFIGQDIAVRRLTPRECERLQGFPDDWTAGQKDGARYKQMGNAVAVPVAEWIARRIAAVSNITVDAGANPESRETSVSHKGDTDG